MITSFSDCGFRVNTAIAVLLENENRAVLYVGQTE